MPTPKFDRPYQISWEDVAVFIEGYQNEYAVVIDLGFGFYRYRANQARAVWEVSAFVRRSGRRAGQGLGCGRSRVGQGGGAATFPGAVIAAVHAGHRDLERVEAQPSRPGIERVPRRPGEAEIES